MRKNTTQSTRLSSVLRLILIVVIFLGPNGQAVDGQQLPKRELRAAWIATVAHIDWPSKKGLTVAELQQEYIALLDTLRSIGMNAVIVQVRPVADAFYPSSFEPWSEYLTGAQGKAPTPYFNPLSFMIDEARSRGLEFHAWFNPYRAAMTASFDYADRHPIRQHPEWFLEYGGKYYYDPGHPEAREFVLASILETVRHYDLDAVHFDDYFYPYRVAGVEFPDSCTYESFGHSFAGKDEWRRNNVDFFVEELSRRIKAERPHMKFGISPFGVWRNADRDPAGSRTRAGVTNYDDLYADVLKWLREGWIDYVTPQLYWNIGFEVADYTVLADWWSKNSFGKHLYIGHGVYRLGSKGWENPEELSNQVALNRGYPNIHGSMYFSSKVFLQNKDNVNARMRRLYQHKALVPVMDWLPSDVPSAPMIAQVSGTPAEGITLQWKDGAASSAAYYVIYRFENQEAVNLEDAGKIVAVEPRKPYALQTWADTNVNKRSKYRYVVTAVSRLHRESEGASMMITTKGKRKHVAGK